MYGNNGLNAYRNNSVNHSSKAQLLLMLVDGAIRFAKVSRQAMEDKDISKCHENIIKTQNIFTELMISLDQSAGEWAVQMYNLYYFIKEKLVEANIKKDIKIMDETMALIEEVRDIWNEADKILKGKI